MTYKCPKCGVGNPDAWCGGCGIEIEEDIMALVKIAKDVKGEK